MQFGQLLTAYLINCHEMCKVESYWELGAALMRNSLYESREQSNTRFLLCPLMTKKGLVLLKANSSGLCGSVGHLIQVREQVCGTGHKLTFSFEWSYNSIWKSWAHVCRHVCLPAEGLQTMEIQCQQMGLGWHSLQQHCTPLLQAQQYLQDTKCKSQTSFFGTESQRLTSIFPHKYNVKSFQGSQRHKDNCVIT